MSHLLIEPKVNLRFSLQRSLPLSSLLASDYKRNFLRLVTVQVIAVQKFVILALINTFDAV